jgi:hypothetical protein
MWAWAMSPEVATITVALIVAIPPTILSVATLWRSIKLQNSVNGTHEIMRIELKAANERIAELTDLLRDIPRF